MEAILTASPAEIASSLSKAMSDSQRASGLGHDFYSYPARMSPAIAREVIARFSPKHGLVMDPFMGSGTTAVEAIAAGRQVVASDISAISYVLTAARTTRMSRADQESLKSWAVSRHDSRLDTDARADWYRLPHGDYFAGMAGAAGALALRRRRLFARACLLRLGQWALDRTDSVPSRDILTTKLLDVVEELSVANAELIERALASGLRKQKFAQARIILQADAAKLDAIASIGGKKEMVDLVLTSPPYPGVHVLYHRWQLRSRQETAAPFWMIQSPNGHGPSYFTLGGRHQRGIQRYFESMSTIMNLVNTFLRPGGWLCMVIAFSEPETQLPLINDIAFRNGFNTNALEPIWREVPNRKWYARRGGNQSAAREVLLAFRKESNQQAPRAHHAAYELPAR